MRDEMLAYMRQNKIPITRARYLALAYLGDIKDPNKPLDPELEAELPEELQIWS